MEKTYKLQDNAWVCEKPLTKQQHQELRENRELIKKETEQLREKQKSEQILLKKEPVILPKGTKPVNIEVVPKVEKLEIKPETEKPTKEHEETISILWDKHKPEEADAIIISSSITIDEKGKQRGIINYRVNGEHRQKRI